MDLQRQFQRLCTRGKLQLLQECLDGLNGYTDDIDTANVDGGVIVMYFPAFGKYGTFTKKAYRGFHELTSTLGITLAQKQVIYSHIGQKLMIHYFGDMGEILQYAMNYFNSDIIFTILDDCIEIMVIDCILQNFNEIHEKLREFKNHITANGISGDIAAPDILPMGNHTCYFKTVGRGVRVNIVERHQAQRPVQPHQLRMVTKISRICAQQNEPQMGSQER